LLGLALMLLATLMFAGMDTVIRHANVFIPALLLITLRYAFQVVVMGVWIAADHRLSFRAAHPRFQVVRGALLLTSSICSFFALKFMPVPEFTAIGMLTPVLVMLLAAAVLRERVTPLRWVLVGGSFMGALIVIRPGSGLVGWAALLPLCGALSLAVFQILTRRLSGLDAPLTTHFWTGLTGTALILPVLLWAVPDVPGVLAQLSAPQWGLALAIGLLGTFGHLLLIVAHGQAQASMLAPFTYAQIGWAVALSWLAFGTWPDALAVAGMTVITLCGAANAWLNVRSAHQAQQARLSVLPRD
jgi:drug/metabolite transporter (DMT)-like permease